jgi:basic membrane protein A and related proteins
MSGRLTQEGAVGRTARAAAALTCVGALALAACTDAEEPPQATPSASATPSSTPAEPDPDFTACLLRATGDFEDEAFGEAAGDGLARAATELGIRTVAVEAALGTEYAQELAALVDRGCDVTTTVRYLLADATRAAARRNPGAEFAMVDFAFDSGPGNLKGLLFDAEAPAFLAGYLAAGVSETGTVGTFGGAQIPSVTVYMDGFQAGIERYNDDNGTEVQLLGWDREEQKGTFINDFASRAKAQSVATERITQGADVVLPVAGAAGLGALRAVDDAGARAIWPDTDGCVSAPVFCDVILTSVLKRVDVAVFESIRSSVEGGFDDTTYVGTLANGGVGLASYHQQQDAVPEELDAELDELEQELVEGELEIE